MWKQIEKTYCLLYSNHFIPLAEPNFDPEFEVDYTLIKPMCFNNDYMAIISILLSHGEYILDEIIFTVEG